MTSILIPAADCVQLLHQLVIGPVTAQFNVMVLKSRITLIFSQTGCTVASQLGFELVSLLWRAGSHPLSQAGLPILNNFYNFFFQNYSLTPH